MRVRGIPKDRAAGLADAPWVDRTRAPYADGDTLWVPVIASEPCDREIPGQPRYTGRGYYRIGEIAVVHGRRPTEPEIEGIRKHCHPAGILWIRSLRDATRTPETVLVSGRCGEVRHREAGITYILDPAQVMFSMGNREEKARVAGLVREACGNGRTERIADMFAGIGYFSLPMAAAGGRVHAMEINPVAFGYLCRSIEANGLAANVTPSPGDCRTRLAGTYDRIVMGHFDAIAMLPDALRHARPGTMIHLHSVGQVEDRIRRLAEGAGFSAGIQTHKVKKYRPHAWHVVQDVTLG